MTDTDLSTTVTALHAHGVTPDLIATTLNLPITQVNQLILNVPLQPPVLDERLASGYRQLVDLALDQARKELLYGPTERRIAIMKQLLAPLGRHIASSPASADDTRTLLESLFAQMKDLPDAQSPTAIPRPATPLPLDVSSRPVYDPDSAGSGTVVEDPDDQDEGSGAT